VAVLIFLCVIAIGLLFIKGFGTRLAREPQR
jgi:hypothetical protein